MAEQQPERGIPYTRGVKRLAAVRRLLAVGAVGAAATVLAIYGLNRRSAAAHPLKVIAPLGINVTRSADGFTLARDVAGRPVFRISATRAEQLKPNGNELLHTVRIELFDEDGALAEEISGEKFGYDPRSGEVVAHDAVEINAAPASLTSSGTSGGAVNESAGGAMPIHIEAHDLTYNTRTESGSVAGGVKFRYGAASGEAGEARTRSHPEVVELTGGVKLDWPRGKGEGDLQVESGQAEINRTVGTVELMDAARVETGTTGLRGDRMLMSLRPDNTVRAVQAWGHVRATDAAPQRRMAATATQAQAEFAAVAAARGGGTRSEITRLELSGGVELQGLAGSGGRGELDAAQAVFRFEAAPGGSQLQRLEARGAPARLRLTGNGPQRSVAAPELDFLFAGAQFAAPQFAEAPRSASGAPTLVAVDGKGRTEIDLAGGMATAGTATLGKSGGGPVRLEADAFHLELDAQQQPTEGRGEGNVVLSQAVPTGMQTSRSDAITLAFLPAVGVKGQAQVPTQLREVRQNGNVIVQSGARDLHASALVYRPLEGQLRLSGGVRASDTGLLCTAPEMTVVRDADESEVVDASGGVAASLLANSAVKVGTASGPLLNRGLPVAVTAATMHLREPPAASGRGAAQGGGVGVFSGQARLWQGANVLMADRIQLDQAAGVLDASGNVRSSFVAPAGAAERSGARGDAGGPISISADHFHYDDGKREGVYEGNVAMQTAEARMTAERLKVELSAAAEGPASVERAEASGQVRVRQPGREAQGNLLVYTLATGMAVLSGGPPSIFDAEHGKITGESLTFSPANDAITVESKSGTRTLGQFHIH